ncbi:MAG TPA: 50S ribosomal protein L10 [Actinomycetota bacterium]|nr:50S ribosomal protein L10 [Actinomycetota bacterium]
MPRAEKVGRVAELKARIEASDALLLTEYRGLTVADITELRRSLSEGGARFAVVKNTLMRRAATDAAIAELESLLEGPTAVAFVTGDAVAAAKKVVDAAKKYPTLVIKGAYMDGRLLSAEDARALADLESREAMLSKIAGLMKSEMSRAASMFQALQSQFVGLLEAYKEKVPGEDAPPSEPAEATEAPAAETTETAAVEETPEVAESTETPVIEETAETPTEEASEAPASDEQEEE